MTAWMHGAMHDDAVRAGVQWAEQWTRADARSGLTSASNGWGGGENPLYGLALTLVEIRLIIIVSW